jgi:DNA-binding transcriptional MerR regulator
MALLSGTAVAERSGCSYRQIHYWTDQGYLVPLPITGGKTRGTGNTRIYDESHVLKARLMKSLMNTETAARVAADLIDNKVARVPGFTIALTEWSTS